MAPQSSSTDLTGKDELILKDAHTTKKARDSNTVQLQEQCDWRKLQYIVQHYDELQLPAEKKPDVIKYAESRVPAGNQSVRSVTINYSQANPGLGRLIARDPSLQTIPRTVRHTIAAAFYYDIDIVNCAPTLLSQYCIKHDIPTPTLASYVSQREAQLAELMKATGLDREGAKSLVLAMLNGGRAHQHLRAEAQHMTWVRQLQEETRTIFKALERLEPEIWRLGHTRARFKQERGDFYNPMGSCNSLLSQNLENQCLMALMQAARDMGVVKIDAVLMFDGIMILHEDVHAWISKQNVPVDLSGLLQRLEMAIQRHTGFEVRLTHKPMDQGLELPVNWEHQTTSLEEASKIIIKDGEREASNVFLQMVSDEVKRCEGVVYARIGGIWTCEKDRVKDYLVVKALDANMYTLDSRGKELLYSARLSCAEAIVRATMMRVSESPGFVEELWRSSKGKLCFQNGYWDFEQHCFVEGFDKVHSPIQIDRPFPTRDEASIRQVYDRLLYPIWGDDIQLKAFLWMLARATAGHCEDKVWSVVMGERNSGKSIIGRLLKTALGPYVTTIVPENLLVTHGKSSGADEAVKRSWMYLMQFSRLTITNEFRKLPGLKVDGNMLKQTTSGSDLVAVRKRYGHDENIKIMATLVMMCNDFPDVECTDALETLVPFAAPHKFVNEDELDPTDLASSPRTPALAAGVTDQR